MAKLQIKTPRQDEQIPITRPGDPYTLVVSGEGRPGRKNSITITLQVSVGGGPLTAVPLTSNVVAVAPPNWVAVLGLTNVDTAATTHYRVTVTQPGHSSFNEFTFYQA